MLSSATSTSSSGTSGPTSMSFASLMPSSPGSEISDENSSRFNLYLHRLAGYSGDDADDSLRDHCYARPWNWKPENIYVKPAKKIFFGKTAKKRRERENSEIRVNAEETVLEDSSVFHDLSRSRHQMDEFLRLSNFARPEENEDDWEEKIEKILWLPVHHRIFSRVMRILTAERLARLAKSNSSGEPIFRRISVDTAAKRFRETLASTGWNPQITQWLHCLLFDHLPRDYLAIYLDILQTLRAKMPQLIDRMMSVQPNISGKAGSITWETLGSLLKRSWDPLVASLNSNKPTKLPGNPILILAPSGINPTASSRQHKWIALLGNLGTIVNVHTHLGISANRMTMMTCLDQLVQATRAKIQDVRVDFPGRPIVLIGFNSGAALACQIAQMEHVTAVICLGFPFMTAEGKRGNPDDTLMDMRCPVMFVIGENASLATANDLEDVREKMLVETCLVVVGTADDHLRVTTAKKMTDGITQAIVDRCITNEIGDFVAGILLQPQPLPLRSLALPSCDNAKSSKKEPRKRKNSTSSSVESESNSPSVKKNRPETPVASSTISTVNNTAPTSVGPKPVPLVNSQPPINVTATSVASCTTQTPVQKKKNKASNYQKYHFTDKIVSSRNCSQQTTSTGNGGITLNIGSLASLAPIGPIKLAPTGVVQALSPPPVGAAPTPLKSNANSRSPITLAKIPKIIQTKIPHTSITKNKANASTQSKGSSKVMPTNNIVGMDMKSINSTATISANAASQTKITANTSTSGSLTALLQSGKSPLGVVGTNSIGSYATSLSSSNILLTSSSIASGPNAGTITMESTAKVTDIGTVVDGSISDNSIETNTSSSTVKNHRDDCKAATSTSSLSSPILLPITNKTPITILPISGKRARTVVKNQSKTVPKITINSQNFHKTQTVPVQALSSTSSSLATSSFSLAKRNPSEIDDDLGNILDIPIIFAKDGDNLGMIERASTPPRQIQATRSIDHSEKSLKRLGPATKVVLISNKQDKKAKTIISNQCCQNFVRSSIDNQTAPMAHQVVPQPQKQTPISVSPDWHGLPLQSMQRSNQSIVKYTKIILAKRSTDSNNSLGSSIKSEPILLTKGAQISDCTTIQEKSEHRYAAQFPITMATSSFDVNDTLEIEDAIKTNIIERKVVNIPEIDLTSPIKRRATEESLEPANAAEQNHIGSK